MAILRVDCITSEDGGDFGRIEAVGGEDFYHSAEDAIRNIRNRVHIYYMIVDGEIALIDVREEPATGRQCLQVIARSQSGGNLLHLPECPQPRAAGEKEWAEKKGRAPRPLG